MSLNDLRPSSGGFSRHLLQGNVKAASSTSSSHQQPPTSTSTSPASASSTSLPLRSSYAPPMSTKKLYTGSSSSSNSFAAAIAYEPPKQRVPTIHTAALPQHAHANVHFERQPPPTIGQHMTNGQSSSTSNGTSGGSPFILSHANHSSLSASPSPPPSSSSSSNNSSSFHGHAVKMPRDSPFLPRSSPTSSTSSSRHSHLSSSPSPSPSPSSVLSSVTGEAPDRHAVEAAMLNDIGLFRDRARAQVTVESLLREKRDTERQLAKARAKDMATINSILPPVPSSESNSNTSPYGSPNASPSSSPSPSPPSQSQSQLDMSLITSLTQRLSTVEKIASKQAKSLGMKDVLIADLQSKVRSIEHSQDAALLYSLQTDLSAARTENDELKKQLTEMESFLNDYGLVWVGYRAGAGANTTSDKHANDDEKNDAPGISSPITTEATSSSPTTSPPSLSSSTTPSTIFFDVPSFIASVNELNSIATDGSNLRIHTTPAGVTKFLPPISLDLILYKDGMWFRNGPLRSWNMPAAQEFVKDIEEGFFPYELKEEFPDGVALAVIDRSKHFCHQHANTSATTSSNATPNPTFTAFKGKGNRLEDGKEVVGSGSLTATITTTTPATTVSSPTYADVGTVTTGDVVPPANSSPSPSPSPLHSSSPSLSPHPQLSPHAPPPQPLDSFLSKLPTHVIQNGKIVEVRGEIGKMLTGGAGAKRQPTTASAIPNLSPHPPSASPPPPSVSPAAVSASSSILIPTPALALIQTRESLSPSERAALPALPAIATLQVKMDPSDQSPLLLMKVEYNTTLGQVREYIQERRKDQSIPFELRTAYPPRNFSTNENERTLSEAGLTPNANLFVRNKRPLSGYRNRQVEQPKPDESWSTPPTAEDSATSTATPAPRRSPLSLLI